MDGAACMGAACGGLKSQVIDNANKCKVPTRFPEEYEGCKFLALHTQWLSATLTLNRDLEASWLVKVSDLENLIWRHSRAIGDSVFMQLVLHYIRWLNVS